MFSEICMLWTSCQLFSTIFLSSFHCGYELYFIISCICWAIPQAIILYGYRILLHPLHSLKGPFVASFTDCYGAFFASRKSLTMHVYRNHQKYGMFSRSCSIWAQLSLHWTGPVYRHGPNKILFNSARALHGMWFDRLLLTFDLMARP